MTNTVPARSWRRHTAADLLVALLLLLLAVAYLVLSLQIDLRREAAPGQMDARAWPSFLGLAAVLAAGSLVLRVMLRGGDARDEIEVAQPGGLRRVGGTIVIALAYLALWSLNDVVLPGLRIPLFPIATTVAVAALLWLYGHRGWKGLVLYPVSLAALNWGLFGMLLRIPV